MNQDNFEPVECGSCEQMAGWLREKTAEIARLNQQLAQVYDAELLQEWKDAYAAFYGAFDTPQQRMKMPDEYSEDARKRMRDINDKLLARLSTSTN